MQQRPAGDILVVDDDALTLKMLVRTLTSAGYSCRGCENGLAAWEELHSRPPSLVLLDLEMPELDGAELVRRLRADKDETIAQIPAIMLTGHSGEQSEVLCLEAGADDFVTKPINTTVLRARIETHLRLRLMRDQLRAQNEELEAWRQNLERDLAAARLTQQSLIPSKPPMLTGWDVAAVFRPVIEVGGDIYGWVRMNDGRMLFWIADATGHGASAALITTLTKLLFHYGSVEASDPAGVMQAVNDDFRGIFGGRSFMTGMCVALDVETGRGSVVGAGHPPLVISRTTGQVELIGSNAPPLGLVESPEFVETTIELSPGESFLLYTDGLFGEAGNQGRRFTPEQLGESIGSASQNAEMMLKKTLRMIAPGDGQDQLPDDVAAVLVLRTG
ncbi:MAG TPA: SpoIIE family protein phosphatase [Chthoniobacterales bacterium]|nr:SpoIIE family protein phosphatase [Chthoniobacterales bacterium]